MNKKLTVVKTVPRYKLKIGFITQRIKDKTTIFSGENSVLYTLNETAAYIFQGIKLGWDQTKIVSGLQKDYEVSVEVAEKDINKLIKQLVAKGIIYQVTD